MLLSCEAECLAISSQILTIYQTQQPNILTKTLEDSLLDTKPPETPALTHKLHLAAKAFNDMLILLGKMRGIAGHPLSYVPSQFERTQQCRPR